jgi:hypothetical protein
MLRGELENEPDAAYVRFLAYRNLGPSGPMRALRLLQPFAAPVAWQRRRQWTENVLEATAGLPCGGLGVGTGCQGDHFEQ